jgi:putative phosphoesterase
MEVAIISDTHLPRGKRAIPGACIERLRAADLIVHAGDLSTLAVLHELEAINTVAAVHGNADDEEVRAALPADRVLELEGARLAVVHNGGPAAKRVERLRVRFPDADAVVFGHSHIPLHEERDGFQIFNPGSATDRRRQPHHTMGIARVSDGKIAFELIALD